MNYIINFEDINNFINFEDINKFILKRDIYASYYYISKTLYKGIGLDRKGWGRFYVLYINFSFLSKRQVLCFSPCVGTVL